MAQNFKVILPVTLEKAKNGDMRIYGLASTKSKDLQGEIVDLNGLNLDPIQKGKGYFNFDHSKEIEDRLGVIDKYKLDNNGLYLGGYLFKNSKKANDLYNIMSSLDELHKGQVGMSIEGVIRERGGQNDKIIKKAVITGVALTFSPVNTDTYCELVKSLSAVEFIEDRLQDHSTNETEPIFTAKAVISLISAAKESLNKSNKLDNAALTEKSQSNIEINKEFFKASIVDVFQSICRLYPNVPKTMVWETVKDRLHNRYPSLKKIYSEE